VKAGPTFLILCFPLCGVAVLCAIGANRASPQTEASPRDLTFHESPPAEPLPVTLDPDQFRFDHATFVAYALASRVRETLYQVPCYCHCDREAGHKSLLDCFTSKHGAMCSVCQKEAVFCYLEQRKGKSPAQIREGMAKGEAFHLNLERYVNRFYKQLADPTR
jgi:hypothetical protein